MSRKPELSVIVPAYLEGARIHDNLRRLLGELDKLDLPYEVLVVSDGSPDDTASEAERVGSGRVSVLAYPVNQGKGFALSYGVQHAAGDFITFIDADMELNPRNIQNFLQLMKCDGYDIVVGSKRHPESRVHYPALRRFQSLAYQLLIRLLFNLHVRDTQVGLKLFRREVLSRVIPLLAVKRFAFDLELLVVAYHVGYYRIVEAPVELSFRFESSVRPVTAFQVLWDTAAIFYRLNFLRYYDRRAELVAIESPAPLPHRRRGSGRG